MTLYHPKVLRAVDAFPMPYGHGNVDDLRDWLAQVRVRYQASFMKHINEVTLITRQVLGEPGKVTIQVEQKDRVTGYSLDVKLDDWVIYDAGLFSVLTDEKFRATYNVP